ncbi:hypothetical protein, partial [Acetobacter pasteurianus]|uniref:hypothetical protein n=1 Tax=Acetobacter pasteurianus TaxID=438 RepID=UPI0024934A14
DHTQKLHVNHSKNPPADDAGECEGMGQISMKISALPGSVLSENQHAHFKTLERKIFHACHWRGSGALGRLYFYPSPTRWTHGIAAMHDADA